MTLLTLNNSTLQNLQNDFENEMTVSEVMEVIQKSYINEKEFFTEVKLDGHSILENEEDTLLATSIGKYRQVDFTSKSSIELAFNALDACTEYLDTLVEKVKETAESYKANRIHQGNRQFLEMTEVLDLFIKLIASIHHILRAETPINSRSNQTLQSLEIHLLSVVKALVPAKAKQDIVMLCDLLEYELVDGLTQWKIKVIPELKRLKSM